MIELTDKDLKNYSQTLFKKLLSKFRRPRVLVVGPTTHPLYDISSPGLAQLVDERKGETFFVSISRDGIHEYQKNCLALANFGVQFKGAHFYAVNALRLSFPSDTFDIIFDHVSLPSITRKEAERRNILFSEYMRVLKKGGILLLMSDHGYSWLDELLKSYHGISKEAIKVIDVYLLKFSRGADIKTGQDTGLYMGNKLIERLDKKFLIGNGPFVLRGSLEHPYISYSDEPIQLHLVKYNGELFVCRLYPKNNPGIRICYIIKK